MKQNQIPNGGNAGNAGNGASYGTQQALRKHRNPKDTKLSRGVIARRRQIAKMRLEGVQDGREIANRLGVSPSTVCRDLQALDQQFMAEASQDIAQHKALDLKRLEGIIGSLWPSVLKGNVQACKAVIEALARKAKMVGYDAAIQVDVQADWRGPARELGIDPDALFQDMVQMVWAKAGAIQIPELDAYPELDWSSED